MFFLYHITTPANTPAGSKQITEMQLISGVVSKVDILFPPGCAGYLYCQIRDALHQVWPSNPDEYFQSAGETISFRPGWPITAEPLKLYAHTWNLDDTYSHTLTIRIEFRSELLA